MLWEPVAELPYLRKSPPLSPFRHELVANKIRLLYFALTIFIDIMYKSGSAIISVSDYSFGFILFNWCASLRIAKYTLLLQQSSSHHDIISYQNLSPNISR